MSRTPTESRPRSRPGLRRVAATLVGAGAAWLASLLLAGPAAAEVPEGWPEYPPVNLLHALLLVGGVTLLVLVVITVMVLGPPLARGETITGPSAIENQWLGGPPTPAGELGPSTGDDGGTPPAVDSGGAGARW